MFLYLVASRRIRCIFKRRGGSHEEKHIRAMFESHPGTDIGSETRSEMAKRRDLVKELVSLVGTPTSCPHCHHAEIRPWGKASFPRYQCRNVGGPSIYSVSQKWEGISG